MKPIRSLLFVPGTKREWIEKTIPETDADGVIIDLEDSVHPDRKDDARTIASEVLDEYQGSSPLLAVRVNGTETPFLLDDLEAIVGPGLDAVMVPKTSSPSQIEEIATILGFIETTKGLDTSVEIIPAPETAEGFRQVYEICSASPRVGALSGSTAPGGDVEEAIGFDWTAEGFETLYLQSKVVLESRAAGIDQILGGVWTDVDNVEGLRQDAEFVSQLGYTGYSLIHPSHVDPVNEVFTPNRETVERYKRLVNAFEEAKDSAAVRFEGDMVDIAHADRARKEIERAEAFDVLD